MSYRVVVVMPVAHRDRCWENLPKWVERGYEVVVSQDKYRFDLPAGVRLLPPTRSEYIGWPRAVNELVAAVLRDTPDYDDDAHEDKLLFVAAGDDMRPDPVLTAQQMAARYFTKFPDGCGVMQPTGDDWIDSLGRIAERICGSPIFGTGWALRAYGGGVGPLWPGYFNFYADEELLNVAKSLGLLWQDPGTAHYHDHVSRTGKPYPETHAVTQARWEDDRRLFESRRDAGWPRHELARG